MTIQKKIEKYLNQFETVKGGETMKELLLAVGFVLAVYIFNILTNQDTNVYTGISLDPNVIPAFSYEDATEVAESLR